MPSYGIPEGAGFVNTALLEEEHDPPLTRPGTTRVLDGRRDDATALIPDELVDDMHIIGTAGEVRERVAQWAETGVTTLLLSCRSAAEVRQVAEVLA